MVAFFAACLCLSIAKHNRIGIQNYKSEIWSDKAGYYIYLPLTFKYDFRADLLPDSIAEKTGQGFSINQKTNKVQTKFTYGLAFFEAPFYLMADLSARITGYEQDGFSKPYNSSISLSGVFYLVLGLCFLSEFLKKYYSGRVVFFTLTLIFLASNLFYYGIHESGMSHIYSFFLFSLALFFCDKHDFLARSGPWVFLILGFILGFIVLIRPVNLLFLSFLLFLNIESWQEIRQRFKNIAFSENSVFLYFSLFLVFLPQFFYWHSISGKWIFFSYENESFNWSKPMTILSWFSPGNGLFSNSPLWFLLIFSCFRMLKSKPKNGLFLLILFAGFSYIFSCWWSWGFGCAFGARSFVEYLPLFSLPLCHFIAGLKTRKAQVIMTVSGLLLIYHNLKMSYSYGGCFYGVGDWDWNCYFNLLTG